MGHKKVCLDCKISVNRDVFFNDDLKYPCVECGKPMMHLPHRFRPPKKTDTKAWEVVVFLINNGFPFQHIYQEGSSEYLKQPVNKYVPYPLNMRDAREFVEKYKAHALKPID